MGQDIRQTDFDPADFAEFQRLLAQETEALQGRLDAGDFDRSTYVAGLELEACLVDRHAFPAGRNAEYLQRLASQRVGAELSRFNIEINGTPRPLRQKGLAEMESELRHLWAYCCDIAHEEECTLAMIGILPTLRESDLCLANMTPLKRFYALNREILLRRGGRPLHLDIRGHQRLTLSRGDVMLEAGATSFQPHMQVPVQLAPRYFNASLILSAPLVAVSANSPYLFGRQLWEETRIPLVEQAVNSVEPSQWPRVTFGAEYMRASPIECFRENLRHYPVLLPVRSQEPSATLPHLRLHHGTIWRWNRPLIGFDDSGTAHVRIEQRVMPAGPSHIDMIANAALYFGAAYALATRLDPPEDRLPFRAARENFYRAARQGLAAPLEWLDGEQIDAGSLLQECILPLAKEGLLQLRVDSADIARYTEVIAARLRTGQTGAAWQRAFVAAHGSDCARLTAAYLEHQRSAMPVHEWDV
ncbi:MAG TPA: hypothetical protein VEB21_13060 [Terriglobales bacterium]|nr:hypothetical protein [Terriglobales bacterium]